MALVKPENLDFSNQKYSVIISGYAGIGKSTLAASAPKPLLIDIEKGISRINPKHRPDSLQVNSYEEILKDLETVDLSKYETIIIDTGGELLESQKPYIIKANATNGQRDGSLSIKGYGAIGVEFGRFTRLVKEKNKHVVYIFHTKEVSDGDVNKLRIDIEGRSKDNIWRYIDIGGFYEIIGNKRTIGFSNCERYFAKGVHGIKGVYTIPELTEGVENNFLTKLFETMTRNIQESQQANNEAESKYRHAMRHIEKIKKCTNETHINAVMDIIKKEPHYLTSERELLHYLNNKAKSLNLSWSKESGKYEAIPDNNIAAK